MTTTVDEPRQSVFCPVCGHDRMAHTAWGCESHAGTTPYNTSRCGCAMPLVAITPPPRRP